MRHLILALLTVAAIGTAGHAASRYQFRDTTLTCEERVNDLLKRLTVDEKIGLLRATSPAIPRLGISGYNHGNEALHGVVRPGKFTVFPQAIGLAATWNPSLIHRVATAISDEARGRWNELGQGTLLDASHSGLLTFWSPTINMARDPRWGRTPETYGEDPFLTGEIAVAFVRGLQGDHPRYIKCVSTPKHFAVNNEEHNRGWNIVTVPERDLRNYYFPAFEKCIRKGNAQSIMSAYNGVNGYPCSINKWLLTDVLRGDWKFDGYVVSDCGAPDYVVSLHHYTNSYTEAASLCLKAGLDLECGDNVYIGPLKDAYNSGMVTMAEIDSAAYRVLRGRLRLGLFDNPDDNPYNSIPSSVVGCPEHQQLAAEAARQSLVLLKNSDSMLPLDIDAIKSIGVVGINAAKYEFGDYSGTPLNTPMSVLDGLRELAGDRVEVNYAPWNSATSSYTLLGPTAMPDGVKVEYFSNADLSGTPVTVQDSYIYYDPKNQPPNPNVPAWPMSIRWTAEVVAPSTGRAQFAVTSDDGCRLYFDNRLIVDHWEIRAEATNYATVRIEKGKRYKVVLEYFDNGGEAIAKLAWRTPVVEGARPIDKYGDAAHVLETSDVAVAVMGIDRTIEREGQDRETLDLPADQTEFIKEALKINPNLVVVLVAGSSLSINEIDESAPAILYAWYPGEQGGRAVAEALFGDYNPGGRLPLTFYSGMADLPAFDDYDITHGRTYQYFTGKPLYPFGYGLSYTTFSYSDMRAEVVGDSVAVTVTLTNTGDRDGDEVAQLYVSTSSGSPLAPIKQLKGFSRVNIPAGESCDVVMTVGIDDLKLWDEDAWGFVLPEGDYLFQAGASSADLRLQKIVRLPASSGVENIEIKSGADVIPVKNGVEIVADGLCSVTVHDLAGITAGSARFPAGRGHISLAPGFYLVTATTAAGTSTTKVLVP